MITVYNAAMRVSVPAPRGWASEAGSQGGFDMQNFTGPDVASPEQAGVVVQVMVGPAPSGATLEQLSSNYTANQKIAGEENFDFHSGPGRLWRFSAPDGSRSYLLMLALRQERVYGVYVRASPGNLEAHRAAIDEMLRGLALEVPEFWKAYERPDFGLRLKHPPSWKLTPSVSQPGKAFFVGFRSPALAADEGGGTVHATLEVTVAETARDTTLERFYAERVEMLGDNYRLLEHQTLREGGLICDLYGIETQLANYLEKTYYFVESGRSYVFKFNVPSAIYRQIEPWIADIADTFQPAPPAVGRLY
jgi:hypothetical protein